MNTKLNSKLLSGILLTLLTVNMMGCSLFNDEAQLIPELTMDVENTEIKQDQSFDVVLNVSNPTAETLIIKTSCQEFAGLFTYHENKLVGFVGNNSGCSRMINTYEIVPNEKLTFKWNLTPTIVSWNSETASTDSTFATRGEYLVQIRINALSVNGQEYNFDDMEKMLTIR